MDAEYRPGSCALCDEPLTDLQSILDHLRVVHPDEYGDGPERWPDGAVVVQVDPSAMDPDDFEVDQ